MKLFRRLRSLFRKEQLEVEIQTLFGVWTFGVWDLLHDTNGARPHCFHRGGLRRPVKSA